MAITSDNETTVYLRVVKPYSSIRQRLSQQRANLSSFKYNMTPSALLLGTFLIYYSRFQTPSFACKVSLNSKMATQKPRAFQWVKTWSITTRPCASMSWFRISKNQRERCSRWRDMVLWSLIAIFQCVLTPNSNTLTRKEMTWERRYSFEIRFVRQICFPLEQ